MSVLFWATMCSVILSMVVATRCPPGHRLYADIFFLCMLFVWFYAAIGGILAAIIIADFIGWCMGLFAVVFFTVSYRKLLQEYWAAGVFCFLKLKHQRIESGQIEKWQERAAIHAGIIVLLAAIFPFRLIFFKTFFDSYLLKTEVNALGKERIINKLDEQGNPYEMILATGVHIFYPWYFGKRPKILLDDRHIQEKMLCLWFRRHEDAMTYKLRTKIDD